MIELVFFVEEPSAEEMLKGLLPRLHPELPVIRFIRFEGKSDMEKRLERKIRAYKNPDACFVVLRDQDSGDCKRIKAELSEKCRNAGKDALIRIACHELESWYLADLQAVEKAFRKSGLARFQNSMKFRHPDQLNNAKQELSRLVPEYQEVSGSRAIARHLNPANTRSRSFQVFVQGITHLLSEVEL